MQRSSTICELRAHLDELPGSVALVPTMGFLHRGHLALMERALECADHLVVSVFVNPTQFAPGEDLESYPRDLEGDADKCRQVGCDLLFTPNADQLYADDDSTWVEVTNLDRHLCGARRPDHFRGVATVVTKLFNLVAPDVAVFGKKDYQQLAIIRRLVRDLHFPIRIEAVPTVREEDGLALSSRNRYLDDAQRRQASSLSRGLVAAHRAYQNDAHLLCGQLETVAREPVEAQPDTGIEYARCVHPHTLDPYGPDTTIGADGAVLALAVHLGTARLIDNLRLDHPLPEGPLRSLP